MTATTREWRDAWPEILDRQIDARIWFACHCGKEVTITAADPIVICRCGRAYHVSIRLDVRDTYPPDTRLSAALSSLAARCCISWLVWT